MNKAIILTLTAITLLLSGCNPYRKITYKKVDFYKKRKVVEKMDNYDLFIQQGEETYEFEVTEKDDDVLKGRATKLKKEEIATIENNIPRERRDDLIVKVDESIELPQEERAPLEVTLAPEHVNEVDIYAKEDRGAIGTAGTVLLVVFGVIIALTLILVLAIASAVEDGSGSNSNSGTSDSNSGTSDSNSGGSNCFIATMAYGSYDAREVLVLRRFRDCFLQKSRVGRSFIRWYYSNSPAFVEQHKEKVWLNKALRVYLNGMVWVIRPFFKMK